MTVGRPLVAAARRASCAFSGSGAALVRERRLSRKLCRLLSRGALCFSERMRTLEARHQLVVV